ncbi:thioesterase family protein [Thalassotalea sp. G2M2-11]|uniref:acyl-CoA thioesterase n=1 Tax=Thalassotalea sp. G2M2-11 TaxID=2787627 RepID=UPI0019D248B0|nr:thioesterase family protein [Thalassotalea sp. G2M2-11]
MTIDELIAAAKHNVALHGKSDLMQSSEQWTQGRTVFGGLSACLLLAAAEEKVSKDKDLHSLYTSFIGPLLANEPFEIEVSILREGKNVVQVLSKAMQNGQVAVLQQSCFGSKRASDIVIDHIPSHTMIKPEGARFLQDNLEGAPNFIQNFDLYLSDGGGPFSGSSESHTHGWMRFKEAPQVITNAHIVCLIDTWPPTFAQQLKSPAPLSTMNWYLEFINPGVKCNPTDWLAYQCDASYAKGGYGYSDAYIWSNTGEVIAKSHQTITVFG